MVELAGIIILGIFAQWLAWRIKVPAILPLILIGLLFGPLSTYFTADGNKLIQPIYDVATGKGLFPGDYLFYFVSLAIGIILFEGGLTLKRSEFSGVGPAILRLITVGVAITFIGAGLAAHFIMGLHWSISFLFGALVIVTGPTVIAPILQNVPLNRNVATVLKWEGILIDPLGALVAVVVFEFIRSTGDGLELTSQALLSFAEELLLGLAIGTLSAYGLYQLIKKDLIPNYLLNVFTLAVVLGVFVFSDMLAKESGLLSVVVMGMVLGNLEVPRLKEILTFKETLSVLLISILFILLAAHISTEDLELIVNDWRSFALLGLIAFVLRPLSVFASTRRSELHFNEKLFISWVGPRGIVAAGIASLFGISLTKAGVPQAEYITPLVFLIVLGTVLLNAATARPIARLLGVTQESSEGILFIGAGLAARVFGEYLQKNNRHVVLVDNNTGSVQRAKERGLEAFLINIYTDDLEDHFELVDMGYMVAMTSNSDVNNYAMRRYEKVFGENGCFRLITPEELRKDKAELPKERLFSYTDDFLDLNEVARDYPEMHELELESVHQLEAIVKKMSSITKSIPVFVKDKTGELNIIPAEVEDLRIDEAFQMVYLGKELDEDVIWEVLRREEEETES